MTPHWGSALQKSAPGERRELGKAHMWDFRNYPAVQWLRLCALTAEDLGSIPGQGTKIPHASQYSNFFFNLIFLSLQLGGRKKDESYRRSFQK